jgi:hypothetical protein
MTLAQLIAEGLIQTELDRARERANGHYDRRPRRPRRKRRIRLPLALARKRQLTVRPPNGRATVFG